MIDDRTQYQDDQSKATIWYDRAGRYITCREVVDVIMIKMAEGRRSC